MQTTFSLQDWFEHLRHLVPIAGVVHVGAGRGKEIAQYADWSVPTAVFIEADETLAVKLGTALRGRSGWFSHAALVSNSEGEKDFFVATNPNESGVLQPEKLAGFWRNLKTKESRSVKTTTLDALLAVNDGMNQLANYAVIDCLPALPVLQGAQKSIACWDIIIARVVLDETKLPGQGAKKSEIDGYLKANGYACIALEEEKQPAIGRVLYIRDWKTLKERLAVIDDLTWSRDTLVKQSVEWQQLVQQLTQARDEQTKLATERQAQIQQLNQACDEQAKVATERQMKIEQLKQARDEQTKLATERQAQIQQLTQACDEQVKVATERQVKIEQLKQARDEQAKLAAERQAQIQQLTQARDEQTKVATERQVKIEQLTQARDEQAKLAAERQAQVQQLTKARDEQTKVATERQVKIEQLVREKSTLNAQFQKAILEKEEVRVQKNNRHDSEEIMTRQQMMNEELVRAEAQIDLIKDLLLREPGL